MIKSPIVDRFITPSSEIVVKMQIFIIIVPVNPSLLNMKINSNYSCIITLGYCNIPLINFTANYLEPLVKLQKKQFE